MRAYYNEIDPFAANWLRNLIKAGLLPDGDVDDRSIVDVVAADLSGYDQCHFFAGIGGWALALLIAEFPSNEVCWTGSCPCQPFSGSGKRGREKDERHLWPEFCRLIRECRPSVVFGEQVSSGDGLEWLDGVLLDLEECGYRVAAADLPAACVNKPHKRQRLFWVGDSDSEGFPRRSLSPSERRYKRCIRATDSNVVSCSDGKRRRLESGGQPLADGLPAKLTDERMGRLLAGLGELGIDTAIAKKVIRSAKTNRNNRIKCYGNAIVPTVTAKFVDAYLRSR